MKLEKKIFIFTDLDGSLLDRETFNFDLAKSFINKIVDIGIKIIPNSSKTFQEIFYFCKEARIDKTFIYENGSGIYGLNLLDKSLPQSIILSRKKDEIFKIFDKNISIKIKNHCIFISELDIKKQKSVFGLPKNKINIALNREFTIPLIFTGNSDEKKFLETQVKELGLSIQSGGRVLNLGDNVNKGVSMKLIIDLISKNVKNEIYTIGIGDNQNDLEMLKISNYPCFITKNEKKLEKSEMKNLILSKKKSPNSWIEVVKKSLKKIDQDFNF